MAGLLLHGRLFFFLANVSCRAIMSRITHSCTPFRKDQQCREKQKRAPNYAVASRFAASQTNMQKLNAGQKKSDAPYRNSWSWRRWAIFPSRSTSRRRRDKRQKPPGGNRTASCKIKNWPGRCDNNARACDFVNDTHLSRRNCTFDYAKGKFVAFLDQGEFRWKFCWEC